MRRLLNNNKKLCNNNSEGWKRICPLPPYCLWTFCVITNFIWKLFVKNHQLLTSFQTTRAHFEVYKMCKQSDEMLVTECHKYT